MHNFLRQNILPGLLVISMIAAGQNPQLPADSLFKLSTSLVSTQIDSSLVLFKNAIEQVDEHTALTQYRYYIVELIYASELDAARALIDEALKLPYTPDQFDDYGMILDHKLEYFKRRSEPDSAISLAEYLFSLANNHNHTYLQISSMLEMGAAYESVGSYTKALDAYFKALSIAEKSEELSEVGACYNSLANLYNTLDQKEESIEYHKKSLAIFEKMNNQPRLAQLYNNMGLVLDHYDLYDSARVYFEKGLQVSREIGSQFGVAITTMNLGLNSYRQKQYQQAIDLFNKSLEYFQNNGDAYGQTLCYYNYCRIYYELGQLSKAKQFAVKGYQLARERQLRNELMDLAEYLSYIEEDQGNFEESLQYYKVAGNIRDSLYNESKSKEIGRLESKSELESAQLKNQLLTKEQEAKSRQLRVTYIITAAVILLLLVVIIFLVIFYKTNKKLIQSGETIKIQADRLKALDAYKSRFFANISHDLRTPVSLIYGYLKDLRNDEDSYFTQRAIHTIDKGLKNTDRLIQMTEEIRDLILLEEGNLQLNYRRVKINKYLSFLIELFRSSAESMDLELMYQPGIDEKVIAVDPNQFEKIIYNLLSNAIKFTDEGRIDVILDGSQSAITITIKDTGKGMSGEVASRVFDRFYQAPDQEYNAKEGMGIGLFLVKELVDLHQGTIEIDSTEGVGTTFTLVLPAQQEIVAEYYDPITSDYITGRNEIVDTRQPIQQTKISESKATVLVVDDHPEVRDYIGYHLKDEYNVLFASNGLQALGLLQKMNVNLLITDLMMPLMDGFELLKQVKEKYSQLPAMVVSARSSIKDTSEILGYGINDFISKPFDKDNFLLRVRNLVTFRTDQRNLPMSEKDQIKLANNRAITQLHELIELKMEESKVAITEIASTLCLSERQANRVIKSLTGKAPGEYVKEYKLTYAEGLLKAKEISSASELAKMVGYSNVTHFNQAFEKKFGYRPSEIISE